MRLEGKSCNILLLQLSLTLSVSEPHTKQQKKPNQCCTGVCSRYRIMADITFHASDHTEIRTQVQAPRRMEEDSSSRRDSQGLGCQVMRSLPTGAPAAPRGKYSSLRETAAFPHQDLFRSTGNKAIREYGGETWFLYILYTHSDQFFSCTKGDPAETEEPKHRWQQDKTVVIRAGCDAAAWECSLAGCAVIELPAEVLLRQCGIGNQEGILYILAGQKGAVLSP